MVDVEIRGRVAERLILLNDRAEGLLCRFYHSAKLYSEKPSVMPAAFKDKRMIPFNAAIEKDFPKIPWTLAIPLATMDPGVLEDTYQKLIPLYRAFVDTLEVRNQTVKLFHELVEVSPIVHMKANFTLVEQCLQLLRRLAALLVLQARFSHRKMVVVYGFMAFKESRGSPEPHFERLIAFLDRYTVPFGQLADDLNEMKQWFGDMAQSTLGTARKRFFSTAELLKERTFSMCPYVEDGHPALPYDLSSHSIPQHDYLAMVTYVYLIWPDLLKTDGGLDFVSEVLSSSYTTNIFRDEVVGGATMFTALVAKRKDTFSDHAPFRKAFLKATEHAVKQEPQKRLALRAYLRQAMEDALNFISEQPYLTAVHLNLLLRLCASVVDELLWLFVHFQTPCDTKTKAKYDQDDYRDPSVPYMFHLLIEIVRRIRSSEKNISQYYIEWLKDTDLPWMQKAIKDLNLEGTVNSRLNDIATDLVSYIKIAERKIDKETMAKGDALRLDWARVQAAFATDDNFIVALQKHLKKMSLMNDVILRTMCIDALPRLLEKMLRIRDLWWYRDTLLGALESSLDDLAMCRFAHVYPYMCQYFAENSHPYVEEERTLLVDQVKLFLGTFNDQIVRFIAKTINALINHFNGIEDKLLPVLGGSVMYARMQKKSKKGMKAMLDALHDGDSNIPSSLIKKTRKDKKKKKKDGDSTAARPTDESFLPEVPGQESSDRHSKAAQAFTLKIQSLVYLLKYVDLLPSIDVGSQRVNTRGLFEDSLEKGIEFMLFRMCEYDADKPNVLRPTVFAARVQTLRRVLLRLEESCKVDTLALLSKGLSTQKFALLPNSGRDVATVGQAYVAFYYRLLTGHAANGTIVASPSMHTWLSSRDSPVRFEEYTDITELRALGEFMGPDGMRQMDQQLAKALAALNTEMKECTIKNHLILEQFEACWDRPDGCRQLLSKLHPEVYEEFRRPAVTLGVVTCFRNLITEAIRSNLQHHAELLHRCVQDAFTDYATEESLNENSDIRQAAFMAGINQHIDPLVRFGLRNLVSQPAQDVKIYRLQLVYAAMVLWSMSHAAESDYNIYADSSRSNVAAFISMVTVYGTAALELASNGDDDIVKSGLALYNEIISTLTMRTRTATIEAKLPFERTRGVDAIFVMCDRFTKECNYLTPEAAERCMPYILKQLAYRARYTEATHHVPTPGIDAPAIGNARYGQILESGMGHRPSVGDSYYGFSTDYTSKAHSVPLTIV
eukprot:Clim_evm103s210 gene=Clim_evmTU103s210